MKYLLPILSFIILLGSCKKEAQTQTCPEIDVPYESIKTYGEIDKMIRVVIYHKSTIKDTEDKNFDGVEGPECIGTFMKIEGWQDSDPNIHFYKISNDLPSWVIDNTNYGNSEWLVNVKYLGVGIECYVDAFLVDPMPGGVVYKNEVELVEITHIEPA